jgi:hypothetical protein
MAKICSIVKFASSPTFHPHLGHHRILINSGQTWFRVDRHRRSFFEARPSVAQLSSSKALLSSSRGCDNLNAVHGMQWSSLLHAIVECTDPPKVWITSMETKIAFTPGLVGVETTNGGGGSERHRRWDPSSVNSGSKKRMEQMECIGSWGHEGYGHRTSVIFGSGGAVQPDRLGAHGAVLVWSDWVVWVLRMISTN